MPPIVTRRRMQFEQAKKHFLLFDKHKPQIRFDCAKLHFLPLDRMLRRLPICLPLGLLKELHPPQNRARGFHVSG